MTDSEVPTCGHYRRAGDGEFRRCGRPAPNHGLTMSGENVQAVRVAICDECHADLRALQQAGQLPPPPPPGP